MVHVRTHRITVARACSTASLRRGGLVSSGKHITPGKVAALVVRKVRIEIAIIVRPLRVRTSNLAHQHTADDEKRRPVPPVHRVDAAQQVYKLASETAPRRHMISDDVISAHTARAAYLLLTSREVSETSSTLSCSIGLYCYNYDRHSNRSASFYR